MRGFGQVPPAGRVRGVPVDAVVRVSAELLVAGTSVGAMLAFGNGRRDLGTILAVIGGLFGLTLAGARVLEEEGARARQASGGA